MLPLHLARTFGLATVLERQDGLIRRDQALACGLSTGAVNGLVRRGTWHRLLPRVYLVGDDTVSTLMRIRAGWLWAGQDSVVAFEAAAILLGTIPAGPIETVDLIVPRNRSMSPVAGWTIHRLPMPDHDWCWRNGIRVTNTARTCLDLVRSGRPDHTEEALRLSLTDPHRLVTSVARGRYRPGQLAARDRVDDLADCPWSPAERIAHRLLRSARIVGWKANRRIEIGSDVLFLDIVFEEMLLAIEIDGRTHHQSGETFERDRTRQNLLVLNGWTVLRFTWRQLVHNPEQFVATVHTAINGLSR